MKSKQSQILLLLIDKETMTFQEICEAVTFGYYRNGKHYIGQILSNMVKNGKIARVKRGVYKYVKDYPNGREPFLDPNQTTLL